MVIQPKAGSAETSMTKRPERRRFHRFPFDASGEVRAKEANHSCELVDISISGALLELGGEHPCEPGDRAAVRLQLSGDVTDQQMDLEMALEVVRVDGSRIGCRWIGMDPDSFVALADLVARNLGDPALLDRELTQLDFWPGVVLEPGASHAAE